MNIALALVVPGLVGGLFLAGLLARLNRRPSSGVVHRSTLDPISPDVINMAHIRVAGVGGLSMIAAGIVIAVSLPEIGFSLLAGVGFGAMIAVGLVVYRSRATAARPGGHDGLPPSVLALDDPSPAIRRPEGDRPARRRHVAIAA